MYINYLLHVNVNNLKSCIKFAMIKLNELVFICLYLLKNVASIVLTMEKYM